MSKKVLTEGERMQRELVVYLMQKLNTEQAPLSVDRADSVYAANMDIEHPTVFCPSCGLFDVLYVRYMGFSWWNYCLSCGRQWQNASVRSAIDELR